MFGPSLSIGMKARTGTPPPTPAPAMLPTFAVAPQVVYGMGQMVAGYSGDSARLVRASDSATLSLPNVSGEVDVSGWAAFASGTTTSGDIWYDQSGNTGNATQTVAGSRPFFTTANAMRGKYPISTGISPAGTTGTSKFFDLPGIVNSRQSVTVLAVLAPIGGPVNTYGAWSLGTGNAFANLSALYDTTSNQAPLYPTADTFRNSQRTPNAGQPNTQVIRSGSGTTQLKHRLNGVEVAHTTATAATLTGGFIGKAGTATEGPFHYLFFAVYPGILSDAEVAQFEAWAATRFNFTLAPTVAFAFDGDSITQGNNQGAFGRTLPFLTNNAMTSQTYTPDFGIAGQTAANIYARRATTLAQLKKVGTTWYIAALMGTNDIALLASGAIVGAETTIWTSYILPYIQYMRDNGCSRVFIGEIINRLWAGSATDIAQRETVCVNLNALINANAAAEGYTVVPYRSISQFSAAPSGGNPNPPNLTYIPDGVHPNAAGYVLMGAVLDAARASYVP